jgi:UDP-3-O-[3-hydroxymyristoyl] glucosamine N-acyltransferase
MNLTVQDIINSITVIDCIGDKRAQITEIKSLSDNDLASTSLFWCSDANIEQLKNVTSGIGLISSLAYSQMTSSLSEKHSNLVLIVVEKPRAAFMQILKNFFNHSSSQLGKVHPSVHIDNSVVYNPEKVYIGANVIIESGVIIGDNSYIDHNTVIKKNTQIGNHVKIGCNNTIGGAGFGYEPNENGEYEFIVHIGNVIIKDYVEIGNNTCIDRAVLGSTIIGEHTKIDNLVHIAHGVKIGKNSLIIANSMIAGSAVIGDNVWISPSVSVKQKIKVEDNSLVGMGAVVIKDVEQSSVMAGVPAKKIKDR